MPFACIYVPNFPLAALLRAEPELHAKAVAILEGKPPLEKVLAISERATSITPGMAKAQAELCTELVLRRRSLLQESATHAALLDCAQSFSPWVEDTACDTVLLDLFGTESLLGPLFEIARGLHHRAADLGLEAQVAVAANPDAAILAARGFSGVTVIPAAQEASCLGPLPIRLLFPDRLEGQEKKDADQLLETLDRWGVRNLHALAALPDIALSERLGQKGLHLQQLARGTASRPLVPIEEPLTFEEAVELEHPIVLLEPLAFLLNRLLEQLCARLGSRALATQELRLTLDLENRPGLDQEFESFGIPSESDRSRDELQCDPAPQYFVSSRPGRFSRTLRLPLPMLDPRLFLKLLQLDLNANPPGAPIVKLYLAAEPARPRSAQGGLFRPPSPEPEKLELTLARISSMIGENRVGAVELLDTNHPEGCRMRRFTSLPQESPSRNIPEPAEKQSAVTALRRFRPPLRAAVTLESGQPVQVVCTKHKEVRGEVVWKAGPWRSSGDWWEKEAWSRDEWDIALQIPSGVALYRLVHDLLGGGWFVEGSYD